MSEERMDNEHTYKVLVICTTEQELRHFKSVFPATWTVVIEGSTTMGMRADALYVTSAVDTDSVWFLCSARTRLWKAGSPIIEIKAIG